ncbi:hypothetical protein HYFRA_00004880 [Hymenoscyphus fraxineus]|uniref:Zn(2)-C6 fungal-type domain-containing protein n=1 Tax=Hymenoscyphus fraxineus TaxID=746836 RepID=A0A9N9KKD0_9HELO|nr:hypothetical protein HYFRA_00004880 [Hymenoscyphus fraxineus]
MANPSYEEAIRRVSNVEIYPSHPGERPVTQNSSPSHQLSSASSYADLNYLFGAQDPAMIIPKPGRNRRKSTQGSEKTKHRRTRSGCYTCRSRRVKCDEAHPTCERCRKGGRECVYPEPPTSKGGGSRLQQDMQESPGSSSDEDEGGPQRNLRTVPDENAPQSLKPTGPQQADAGKFSGEIKRCSSETPSLVQDKGSSPTPSSEGSTGYSSYQSLMDSRLPRQAGSERVDWSHLPSDLQFYLDYFYENITHLHYSLKYDSEDFIRTRLLDIALQNEPLLYAIVGFSAFQRTLQISGGKIQDFLQYYNKSVSLLLRSLKRGDRHSHGTILAMLQLATIEEFLGDWINLIGHQKAAYRILTELYTPHTIMQSSMTRIILEWYVRFDVFAGLLGGFETVLSREWFSTSFDFYHCKVEAEPTVLHWKIEAAVSQCRLVATDMSLLFAKMGKGEISIEQFMVENAQIGTRIEEWQTKMDPALMDDRYKVNDFSGAPPRDPNDIVDPYIPGIIYSGPLYAMNVASIDWHSIDLMHRYQTALTTQTQPSADIVHKAYVSCQLFEAMELWPGSPPGTIAACQASIAISVLFLPKDDRHSMWARRKLSVVESNGYIYPYTFRKKMAGLFHDESCMRWWLPNDEGYPTIIRSIRKFVEERSSAPKDLPAEDLRDMKSIFASMNLEDKEADAKSGVYTGQRGPQIQPALDQVQEMAGVVGDETYDFGYDSTRRSSTQHSEGF